MEPRKARKTKENQPPRRSPGLCGTRPESILAIIVRVAVRILNMPKARNMRHQISGLAQQLHIADADKLISARSLGRILASPAPEILTRAV
jgi:hypothetical protein